MLRTAITVLLAATGTLSAQVGNEGLSRFGKATPGTGGRSPVLWANTTPRPGAASFALLVSDGRPAANAIAYVSAGLSTATVGGVHLNVDLTLGLPIGPFKLDANGAATLPAAIPNAASLIDNIAFLQTFVEDSGGAPLGFSASRGVRVRIKRTGLLMGAGSSQVAIDLAKGTSTTFGSGTITNGNDVAFQFRGTHAAYAHYGKAVHLFDVSTSPPSVYASFSTPSANFPWSISFAPDGLRLYVVNEGPANSNPIVQVVWSVLNKTTFGTPYPGTNTIPLGSILDALRIEFTRDSRFGYLGTLGLFGGGAEIRRYDTDPTSSTYNKQIKSFKINGQYMFAFALSPNDDVLCATAASLGNNSNLFVLDPVTLAIKKALPKQPTLGRVVQYMVFHPLGHYIYMANDNHVVRVLVDTNDKKYGAETKIPTGLNTNWMVKALAISDAGDRLYMSTDGGIYEYDAVSFKQLRKLSSVTVNRLAIR